MGLWIFLVQFKKLVEQERQCLDSFQLISVLECKFFEVLNQKLDC